MPLQRVWALPWLGSRLQPPKIAGLVVMAFAAWRLSRAGARPVRHPIDAGVLCWCHYTVFLVTPEGIVMSDPINRDFSRWLNLT